jgi:hypothetical protein
MCGTILLLGSMRLEVPCLIVEQWWRRPPDPGWPIDWNLIELGREDLRGPRPEPWRAELTRIGGILVAAGQLREHHLADRLGRVTAEIGNAVAEQAEVDVRFEWTVHEGSGPAAERSD